MKSTFFKSNDSDFKNSDILVLLNTMQKNILHLTYQNDRILSLLSSIKQTKSAEDFYNKSDEPSEEVENL